VLDAERSAYSAEDPLLQSRVSIATDYIALNKALGGGWDGTIDSAKPEVIDVGAGPRLASGTQCYEAEPLPEALGTNLRDQ